MSFSQCQKRVTGNSLSHRKAGLQGSEWSEISDHALLIDLKIALTAKRGFSCDNHRFRIATFGIGMTIASIEAFELRITRCGTITAAGGNQSER